MIKALVVFLVILALFLIDFSQMDREVVNHELTKLAQYVLDINPQQDLVKPI